MYTYTYAEPLIRLIELTKERCIDRVDKRKRHRVDKRKMHRVDKKKMYRVDKKKMHRVDKRKRQRVYKRTMRRVDAQSCDCQVMHVFTNTHKYTHTTALYSVHRVDKRKMRGLRVVK